MIESYNKKINGNRIGGNKYKKNIYTFLRLLIVIIFIFGAIFF